MREPEDIVLQGGPVCSVIRLLKLLFERLFVAIENIKLSYCFFLYLFLPRAGCILHVASDGGVVSCRAFRIIKRPRGVKFVPRVHLEIMDLDVSWRLHNRCGKTEPRAHREAGMGGLGLGVFSRDLISGLVDSTHGGPARHPRQVTAFEGPDSELPCWGAHFGLGVSFSSRLLDHRNW